MITTKAQLIALVIENRDWHNGWLIDLAKNANDENPIRWDLIHNKSKYEKLMLNETIG